MTTERSHIDVSGISVEIRRKAIKNLHVGVYPPDGKVRVAAPPHLNDEAVRLAIVSRLRWIRRQRESFTRQARQSIREMVTGESHYFEGKRYRLEVLERAGNPYVEIANNSKLVLTVRPGAEREARQRVLDRWYRRRLREQVTDLIRVWESKVGVGATDWRIKRMKTRWGSCNIEAKRIWLNLELIKKPAMCLEYVLVHELVHLLERHHTERFRSLMDVIMPDWRERRDELNRAPLAYDDWDY